MAARDYCGNCTSTEHRRCWKPENHDRGGSVRRISSTCDGSSLACEGSPLAEWEAEYGKLKTTVTIEIGDDGKYVQRVVKEPCPIEEDSRRLKKCCSLRYRA